MPLGGTTVVLRSEREWHRLDSRQAGQGCEVGQRLGSL
jgi:hypothetical protein